MRGNSHVGICAGGAGRLASLPRPLLGSNPSADSGAKTTGGRPKSRPGYLPNSWDWHQSGKSQGSGDGVPRILSFLVRSPSSVSLFVGSALSSDSCLRLQPPQ